MQEKLLKMTSEHRTEMASKRGRPAQLEQGGDLVGLWGTGCTNVEDCFSFFLWVFSNLHFVLK